MLESRMIGTYMPPVIKALLIANGVMFLAELVDARPLLTWLALWPLGLLHPLAVPAEGDHFWPWQIVSYAFLHGSVLHLALNMYALWMFGTRLENAWGSRVFAFYYFTCVIGAALVQLVVAEMAAQHGVVYPTIGASGGVFGLLLAFGMTYADEILMLVFPPIAMRAKWFVLLYGAIELLANADDDTTVPIRFIQRQGK